MLHKIQNRIPVLLTVLGYIYIVSPLGYYLYYTLKSQKPFWDIIGVLTYTGNPWFTVQFLAILLITPIVGTGLVLKRKWGLRLFFVYGIGLVLLNAINYSLIPNLFNIWHIVGNIVLLLVLLLFTRLELQAPFYRPEWQTRVKRHKRAVPVGFQIGERQERSITVDISEEGCFISSEDLPHIGLPVTVVLDPDRTAIECPGKIAWATQTTRRFPSGFGVMFDPLPESKLDEISSLISISTK